MGGTRFAGCRRKVFDTLLSMWPAFIVALENVVADGEKHKVKFRDF